MAKPTAADAQLILKLYDLRREAELRKARHWWVVTFSPQTADDFMKVSGCLWHAGKQLAAPGAGVLGHCFVAGEPWRFEP